MGNLSQPNGLRLMPALSLIGGGGINGFGIIKRVNPLSALLGTAAAFSILGTTISTSGVCSANWDVGVAGLAGVITSVPTGGLTVGGQTRIVDEIALQAYQDLSDAFNAFVAMTPEHVIAGDMINKVLLPGVYYTEAAVTSTGPMTFDDPEGGGVFVIQMNGGAYTPAAGSSTVLKNFAKASNIFWVLNGGALSSGGAANITGVIVAGGAVTIGDGGSVTGQLLSLGGITMANNTILST